MSTREITLSLSEMPKANQRLYIASPFTWTDARAILEPSTDGLVNVMFVEGGRFNWTKEPLRSELVWEYLCTRANTDWRGFTVEYTQWDPATEDTIFEYLQGGVDHECSHL